MDLVNTTTIPNQNVVGTISTNYDSQTFVDYIIAESSHPDLLPLGEVFQVQAIYRSSPVGSSFDLEDDYRLPINWDAYDGSPDTVTFTVNLIVNQNETLTKTFSFDILPFDEVIVTLPESGAGLSTVTGDVTINGIADTGGMTVALTSDSDLMPVPSTVFIPEGASTASFDIELGDPAQDDTTANVTATINSLTSTDSINLRRGIVLEALETKSESVSQGESFEIGIGLRDVVPNDVIINLTSSLPNIVSVPTTITIPRGQSSATFTVTTTAEEAIDDAEVTITASYLGESINASITIEPAVITDTTRTEAEERRPNFPYKIEIVPSTIITGGTTLAVVIVAPEVQRRDIVFDLRSSNTLVSRVPSQVTLSAGSESVRFSMTTTSRIRSNTSFSLTISQGRTSTTIPITLTRSLWQSFGIRLR